MNTPDHDPNKELYNRFRQDLKRPVGERYYAEDELVCIFDTAGDHADDYVRTEVLLLGARLYPDSHELLERRAIFYNDFVGNPFVKFLDDNPSVSTPMWDILKLFRFRGSDKDTRERFESFIKSKRFDSDEEVIQFIHAVQEQNLNDWLYKNIDAIKSKVDYLPTLLFEIALLAEMDGNKEIQIKMLEDLTEIDPYGADYWAMLAGAYLDVHRNEDAAGAVDLALAINPDHYEALKIKVKITDYNDPEYNDLRDKIIANMGYDTVFLYYLLMPPSEHNDKKAIHYLLNIIIERATVFSDAIESAIDSDYPRIEELLTRFYDCDNKNREDWQLIANYAYERNRPDIITLIMKTYEEKSGKSLNYSLLLQLILFRMKKYELAVNTFFSTDSADTAQNPSRMFRGYAIMILSLLRLGRIEEAASGAKTMLDTLDEGGTMMSSFEAFGMRIFLLDILNRLESGEETDWENYDPTAIAAGPV